MKFLALIALVCALTATALASPGAHGPDGEHLDSQSGPVPAGSAARVETFSELFELVGELSDAEFSVMIDRYETNEPVLGGKLEVQYKGMKARATFHADAGDYAVDDAAFLEALAAPGKHALLFTFIAGADSDLLEGTLEVGAPAAAGPPGTAAWKWMALALATGALAGVALRQRRRTRKLNP